MKNNYFKSIGLVLLGGILATIIFSFSPKKSFVNKNDIHRNSHVVSIKTNQQDLLTPVKKDNWVPIDVVDKEVELYQILLKLLPEYFIIDRANNKIGYSDRCLSVYEWEVLFKNLKKAKKEFNSDEIKISIKNTLNHSYFIPQEDIHDLLESFDSNDNSVGVNAYLATKYDSISSNNYYFKTHLYLLPTKKIDSKTLEDKYMTTPADTSRYALDLTHPCPALCDKKSIFYQSKFNSSACKEIEKN